MLLSSKITLERFFSGHSLRSAIWCFSILLATSSNLFAQGTAFTFQGRLTDGGGPANGSYDFQFTLRDSATLGNQVANPVILAPLGVTNGLFSLALDFGAGAFDGSPRWIEVGARTNGSASSYLILSPRTPINATPYAIFSPTPPSVTALSAQVAALSAQVATLSSLVQTNILTTIPAGVPIVSADPQDANLIAGGMVLFQTVQSPPWVNGTSTGVPSGRSGHTVVWTGQQMLIWGGDVGSGNYTASGAGYLPSIDQWQGVASFQAPSARASHSAVWTGTEMIVWGGFGGSGLAAGGSRYNLANQSWAAVSTSAAPASRDGHTAVWTGSRMVVFAGRNNTGLLADGGTYDPAQDKWSTLPAVATPSARRFAPGIWTGTNIVIWGGQGPTTELNSGAQLICNASGVPQQWSTMSSVGAPSARQGHTAIWTGTRVIIWGGQQSGTFLNDGASYDPVNDLWSPLSSSGAPSARMNHVAVWSGTEMLIFGGEDGSGSLPNGAAYDPAKNKWRTLDTSSGALSRTKATGIWSGSQLVLFGGLSAGAPVASPQRLIPQPSWYFYHKP